MFERYTESARRALFFARYEVSRLGASVIDTEHVLLGLIRQNKGLLARILELSQVSPGSLRREIEGRTVAGEPIPTSVEIPFSAQTQRVLRFAAEEAERLLHEYIGPEHLLLGLLREDTSDAALILAGHGLRLDDARMAIVQLLGEPSSPSAVSARDRALAPSGAKQGPHMRKQYYFRQSERGLLAWDVDRLIQLSKDLPSKQIPLRDIRELNDVWFGDDERPTWRAMLEHVRLIEEADLSFPIILSATGAVMDGMHRVAKAALQGRLEIEAVQFAEDPKPDHVGRGPKDLPY